MSNVEKEFPKWERVNGEEGCIKRGRYTVRFHWEGQGWRVTGYPPGVESGSGRLFKKFEDVVGHVDEMVEREFGGECRAEEKIDDFLRKVEGVGD